MGIMLGLKYDAIEKFIEWSTPEGYDYKQLQKTYVPQLLSYGQMMATFVNEKS